MQLAAIIHTQAMANQLAPRASSLRAHQRLQVSHSLRVVTAQLVQVSVRALVDQAVRLAQRLAHLVVGLISMAVVAKEMAR